MWSFLTHWLLKYIPDSWKFKDKLQTCFSLCKSKKLAALFHWAAALVQKLESMDWTPCPLGLVSAHETEWKNYTFQSRICAATHNLSYVQELSYIFNHETVRFWGEASAFWSWRSNRVKAFLHHLLLDLFLMLMGHFLTLPSPEELQSNNYHLVYNIF